MANTDNHQRAAEPAQPPQSDDPRPHVTRDEDVQAEERDESSTPPHGDPLLEASEHDTPPAQDDASRSRR